MKNKDLIKALQKYPEDMEVVGKNDCNFPTLLSVERGFISEDGLKWAHRDEGLQVIVIDTSY